MKVLVTGGLGVVGRPVVSRLVEKGFQVKVIDRAPEAEVPGAAYAPCDITSYAALREQVRGQEAIVHLAAIPSPGGHAGQDIFHTNCTGTYHIFEAAAAEGIRRVILASSINWLGFYYGCKESTIHYFPVDEVHPNFTTDAYSFSKQVSEDIAAYYWRREGISSFCLRMPGVVDIHGERAQRIREFFARSQGTYQEWLNLPPEQRSERLDQLQARSADLRKQRWLELSNDRREQMGLDFANPEVRLISSRNNLWALIDARDAAQAFEKGLLANFEGSQALYVNDSHNSVGLGSEDLARAFFPAVTRRTRPLVGAEALVSINMARELIGFEPEHSFGQYYPGK